MKTSKLTQKELDALKSADAGKRIKHHTPGLYGKVTVDRRGDVRVSFYWRFRWGNRTPDFGCGSWPGDSLAVIGANCKAAQELLAKGINPVEQRQAETAKAKKPVEAPPTVEQFFATFKAKVLHTRADGGAEIERALAKDAWPVIGHKLVADIRRPHLLDVLDAIKGRGTLAAANKALGYLTRLFDYAVKRELIAVNPASLLTRKDDAGGADGERDRVLSNDELRAWPGAVERAGLVDAVREALYVLLGTAARSGELLRARRADFDMDARTWRIPEAHSKNGKPHMIYLNDWVLPHVQALLALSAGSEWLMPDSRDPAQPAARATLINATSDRQRQFYPDRKVDGRSLNYPHALELGNERWTPHDLRRTAATVMGDAGVLPDVIDRALNHVERNKVRRTYQRQVLWDEQRAAWVRLGQRLQALTSPNVIPLPGQKESA